MSLDKEQSTYIPFIRGSQIVLLVYSLKDIVSAKYPSHQRKTLWGRRKNSLIFDDQVHNAVALTLSWTCFGTVLGLRRV